MLLFAVNTNAQSQTDFFVGKWNLLITGYGDVKMTLNLERKDTQLTGTVAMEGYAAIPISSVKEVNESITFSFILEGRTSTFTLKKKDADLITGYSGGGANITGERAK